MEPSNQKSVATSVVDQMFQNDAFSLWLGIERIEESEGYCKLRMKIRKEMLNGFGIVHGGISFSIADSALAFASNSYGKHSVSIECSIKHLKPIMEGDVLIAVAKERSRSKHLGVYEITVVNQDELLVALFSGMTYFKDKSWEI